jgi:hypothetical protein
MRSRGSVRPNCLKAMTLGHSFRAVEEGPVLRHLYAGRAGIGLTQADDEGNDEDGP